mmetsp:Transcript_13948/g.32472  ORF Transcript_13948/g.32472 Transcript_13948/m.32472 type:complete len:212 (+) Transcript_13948:790-1425(+)
MAVIAAGTGFAVIAAGIRAAPACAPCVTRPTMPCSAAGPLRACCGARVWTIGRLVVAPSSLPQRLRPSAPSRPSRPTPRKLPRARLRLSPPSRKSIMTRPKRRRLKSSALLASSASVACASRSQSPMPARPGTVARMATSAFATSGCLSSARPATSSQESPVLRLRPLPSDAPPVPTSRMALASRWALARSAAPRALCFRARSACRTASLS